MVSFLPIQIINANIVNVCWVFHNVYLIALILNLFALINLMTNLIINGYRRPLVNAADNVLENPVMKNSSLQTNLIFNLPIFFNV